MNHKKQPQADRSDEILKRASELTPSELELLLSLVQKMSAENASQKNPNCRKIFSRGG